VTKQLAVKTPAVKILAVKMLRYAYRMVGFLIQGEGGRAPKHRACLDVTVVGGQSLLSVYVQHYSTVPLFFPILCSMYTSGMVQHAATAAAVAAAYQLLHTMLTFACTHLPKPS